MVKLLVLLLWCLTWSVQAQQMLPEKHSERTFLKFSEAAPKIMAAAIARENRGSTDPGASPEQSFERALQYSKHIAVKVNTTLGGSDFSYFSWVPALMGGEINAETVKLQVTYGSMTGTASRELGAFTYRTRQKYETPFVQGTGRPATRIYSYDPTFTFRTLPTLQGSTVVYTNICTGSTSAQARCAAPNYVPGSFKWMWRGSGQQVITACNEISDCLQASISMFFYLKTYNHKVNGYDQFGQYYGNYNAKVNTYCSDSADYNFLQSNIVGMLCAYFLTYDYTPSGSFQYFIQSDDEASRYLSYISVVPVPIVCPGATKYPQFAACDPRFADEAITPKTLAKMVDQIFYWGSLRDGYAGHRYVPVVVADVINALGSNLVKLSSLAEKTPEPVLLAPTTPASGAGAGLDLGANPGVATPTLEEVDAASILAPLWALFPSLRSFSVSGHSSACPVFTPSMFGSSMTIESHCQLIETQRALIGSLALLMWAAVALLVVLKA